MVELFFFWYLYCLLAKKRLTRDFSISRQSWQVIKANVVVNTQTVWNALDLYYSPSNVIGFSIIKNPNQKIETFFTIFADIFFCFENWEIRREENCAIFLRQILICPKSTILLKSKNMEFLKSIKYHKNQEKNVTFSSTCLLKFSFETRFVNCYSAELYLNFWRSTTTTADLSKLAKRGIW